MRNFLHQLWKRLIIHWNTTVISVIIFTALGLWVAGKITPVDLAMVSAFMTGVFAMLSKDANKVDTKKEFRVKDLPEK